MQNKILLLYPPSPVMNREDRCQQPTDNLIVIPPLPPTDLLYMASIAKKASFEPIVKDYSLFNQTLDDFKEDLIKIKPDIVVFNAASTTLKNDMKIVPIIKEVLKNSLVIAKGAHFSFMDVDSLKKFEGLDIVIRGETEETLYDILTHIPFENIKGITYKKDGQIYRNDDRPLLENLDEIPFPARELIDNSLYKRPDTDELQAVIKVSRGCPYHCFFCLATPLNGSKVRTRSPKNIVDEIKECYEKYNIKNFVFWSDIFNYNSKWVQDLCNEIINSKLTITFSANTRADTADIKTVKLMKKAGCKLVSMGVESGSDFMLSKMGKKINTSQIRKTVNIFKKEGIKVYAYYVLGLPFESEETFFETMKFAKSLNTEYVSFYTATALIGTKFYDYVIKNNLGELNFDMPYYYPSVNTHYLSKERVFEMHKIATKSYYARLSYILMMLTKIQSFTELKNYIKAGIRLLFRK